MPFQCECGSTEFWTHGVETIVWYVDNNGDVLDSGDYIESDRKDNFPYYCANCEKEYANIPPKPAEDEWIDLRRRHYLNGNTNGCPICDSPNIEGGSLEADGNNVWQVITCGDCYAEWTDVFTLSDIEVTSYPTNAVPEGMLTPDGDEEVEVPDPNEAFNKSNKDFPF